MKTKTASGSKNEKKLIKLGFNSKINKININPT